MVHNFFTFAGIALTTLFPLINPLGAVPAFSGFTASDSSDFRKSQALRTSVNVVIILVVFLFIGELLLDFFGINIGVLEIAGGLIVGHTAWGMLMSKQASEDKEAQGVISNIDISMMPMAMPILSGPGAIGGVIGLAADTKSWVDYSGIVGGIILLGLVVYICLRLSIPLMNKLGKNGIIILTKMMGFFILAIAVNLIYEGVYELIEMAK